jgi:hypothetical protein
MAKLFIEENCSPQNFAKLLILDIAIAENYVRMKTCERKKKC